MHTFWTLIGDTVDVGCDLRRAQEGVWSRFHDRGIELGVFDFGVEPFGPVGLWDNDGHSVMVGLHHCVGGRCENGGGLYFRAVEVEPALP